jgi:hypothetical protein
LGRASFGPAGGQPFEKGAEHIQIKVQSTPSKNLFAPLFKSGPPQALIINSSYDLNHSPNPILHAIPLMDSCNRPFPIRFFVRQSEPYE